MINNNKILTVSYGTFSCTLEGFEDSFGTMKAIAEYFRDLAADDRYFGAEPPQPDAELLAKIAEREVSRRVEAHEHDGRIMLKAHEELGADTPALTSEASAPESPHADEAKAKAKKKKAKAKKRKAKKAKAKLAAAGLALDGATIVAAEDSGEVTTPAMGEVESEESVAPALNGSAEEITSAETTQLAEEPVADDASAGPVDEETAVAEQPVEVFASDMEIEADDAASFFAQSSAGDTDMMATEETISAGVFTEPTSFEDTPENAEVIVAEEVEHASPSVETESFADKLARIRAVVSDGETQETASQYDEDSETSAADQRFEGVHAAFAETETAEPENEVVAEAAQDIVSAFAQDDAAQQNADLAANEADDLDDILKRIEETADDEDFDLAAEDDGTEDEAEDATENLFQAPAESDDDKDVDEVQGRVLKVNRSDLEAALASGDLEEYANAETEADATVGSDEADGLKDDLEAMENAPEQAEGTIASSRQSLPAIDEETGEDISRLMAEAEHQMEEPEGKTRRSAFAHLRAAVAARFADRSMDNDDSEAAADTEAYRSDLAEVVRPRRPEAPTQRSERPNDDRAAPLKLVAEQRIDAEEEANRGPVSPRRVAASMEDDLVLTDDSGFAAYAEEHGAESLPELLEAAAAYLSYVEGHEQFSRPQLMSRVRQADCGEFTREDGLRSFGQLLRTGKIEKIKGGRFTASEGIGYKPDHRAAG